MKILRVVASMDPKHGGVVEAINQSSLSMLSRDVFSEVLCLDDKKSPWCGDVNGYPVHAIGNGWSNYNLTFNYLRWLVQNAKNYDLIIIDGLWQFLSVGGYLLKLLGIPYCVFTHGMLDPYFNKNRLKYIKKLPFWFLIERNIIALADKVIFTCEEEKKLAQLSFPLYSANEVISTLGVQGNSKNEEDLKESFYSQFPKLRDVNFSLFLSRVHPKKGIDLLMKAMSQVKKIPDDYVLAIAGPATEFYQQELLKLAETLEISNKIVWLNMLTDDIKWGAYHASDVFILPSHQENFGIVVAEALSTSTPVLITNKVNIWQEIEKDRAGFVGADTIDGIISVLESWFLLSSEDKNVMNEKAGACYRKNFSIEVAVQDLESVLRDIVQNGN
jgi:glycosyltransferase involved in cell wall biosynthesis